MEGCYIATYGVYKNCSITGREDHYIEAEDEEEAKRKASDLATKLEEAASIKTGDDWWYDLEYLDIDQ